MTLPAIMAAAPKRIPPDFETLKPFYEKALECNDLRGTEADLVRALVVSLERQGEERLPCNVADKVVTEMAARRSAEDYFASLGEIT